MDIKAEKIASLIPLAIAAGYFLYLIMSWQKYTAFLEAIETKIDQKLASFDGMLRPPATVVKVDNEHGNVDPAASN